MDISFKTKTAHFSHAPVNVFAPSLPCVAWLNIATGLALANKLNDNGKIVVVFSSVESCDSNSWLGTLDFAGQHSLPILFVRQNGLIAEAANHKKQATGKEIAHSSEPFGFPSIAVDGNDVVAIYRVACESIARIRQGRGPTLIDCQNFCLPAQPARSRQSKDSKRAETEDPILSMENYLVRKGLFSQEFKQQAIAGFGKELDAAIEVVPE